MYDEAAKVCMSDDAAMKTAARLDLLAMFQLNIAELALARGDLQTARTMVALANSLPEELRPPKFLEQYYMVAAKTAYAAGDHRGAYELNQRLTDYVDQRRASERVAALAILRATANVERLQAENARLEERSRQQAEQIENARKMQHLQMMVALAGASIVVLLAVIVGSARRYARERRQREEIVAERTRIAGEMHDTLLQQFAGLTLQFQAALMDAPEPTRERFDGLLARGDAILREARQAVWGLRSTALEQVNLDSALHVLAAHWRRPDGPAIRLQVDSALPDLAPSLETTFLRIVQEALANAVRHAGATRVDVAVGTDGGFVFGRIEDDGRGFDTGIRVSGHFGLANMVELARRNGGTLAVESRPGTGTVISVRLPLGRRPLPSAWSPAGVWNVITSAWRSARDAGSRRRAEP